MIRISGGDARDIASIMPIMDDAFDPAFGEAWTASQCLSSLALPYSSLWLAEYSGELAAFAITRWVLDEEELLMIGVANDFRRKGLGAALIKYVKENASRATRTKLFLEVRDGNPAIEFYRRTGFEQIGRRKNYYTGPKNQQSDAITMKCDL